MGKRLLLLGVFVEGTADAMASEYERKLGMRRIATRRREVPEGVTDGVALAGADVAPFLAVFSGKGPSSAATGVLRVLAPGLDRLVYATTDYERDRSWLAARGPYAESRITLADGRVLRQLTALVAELGVVLDFIDESENKSTSSPADLVPAIVDSLLEPERIASALADAAACTRVAIDAPAPPRAHVNPNAKPDVAALAQAQLDHVAIYVSDMNAADEIVRHGLGQEYVSDLSIPLKVSPLHARTFRDPSPHVETRFVITLCHSERGLVTDWLARRGGPGVHHLAHRVANLEGALGAARQAGATQLSAIAEVEWLRQVMLRVTNDGYLHELIWRSDDRELDEANALRLIETQ